jgi:hypothetical protein
LKGCCVKDINSHPFEAKTKRDNIPHFVFFQNIPLIKPIGQTKVGWILSQFFARGTKDIINGETDDARLNAAIAISCEGILTTIQFHKTQANPNYAKFIEIRHCDEHTLVKYFRKHIPCKCLDEKYKKVKSITKIGVCMNPECSLPPGKVERKGMLHCIRCRKEYYCSRECQEAHWPRHREWCDKYVDEQAAFEAMQQV